MVLGVICVALALIPRPAALIGVTIACFCFGAAVAGYAFERLLTTNTPLGVPSTGKPRGLRWKQCDFDGTAEYARDKHSSQIIALLPVTIQFEAIEGGDMEGVAAVSNLRNASAVFFFDRGQWQTVGKAVFNMNPAEALAHFHNQYERIGEH